MTTKIEKETVIEISLKEKDFNNLMYLLGFAKVYFGLHSPKHSQNATKAIKAIKRGIKKNE
jgi:hypothetical protein